VNTPITATQLIGSETVMLLPIGPHTRIYLFPGVTDMRKSFDGLRAIVEQSPIDFTPQCGHIFGFSNRRRNMSRFLYWDGTGFWVCSKKLQQGTFWWPTIDSANPTREVSTEQLSALLGGINLPEQQRPNWLRVKPEIPPTPSIADGANSDKARAVA